MILKWEWWKAVLTIVDVGLIASDMSAPTWSQTEPRNCLCIFCVQLKSKVQSLDLRLNGLPFRYEKNLPYRLGSQSVQTAQRWGRIRFGPVHDASSTYWWLLGYWYLNDVRLHVYSRVWLTVTRGTWFTILNYAHSYCRWTQRLPMFHTVLYQHTHWLHSSRRTTVGYQTGFLCERLYRREKSYFNPFHL